MFEIHEFNRFGTYRKARKMQRFDNFKSAAWVRLRLSASGDIAGYDYRIFDKSSSQYVDEKGGCRHVSNT